MFTAPFESDNQGLVTAVLYYEPKRRKTWTAITYSFVG